MGGPCPRRSTFKKAGLCAVCGERKPKPNRVTCSRCLKRQATYNETWERKKLGEETRGRRQHDSDRKA